MSAHINMEAGLGGPSGAVEALFKEFLAVNLQDHGQLGHLRAQLDNWHSQIPGDKKELSDLITKLETLNRELEVATTDALKTPVSSAVPLPIIHLSSLEVRETWVSVTLENPRLYDLSGLTLRFHCGSHLLESDVLKTEEAGQIALEGMRTQRFWVYLPALEAGLRYEVAVVAKGQQVSNALQHVA